jgi:hypothetical protein
MTARTPDSQAERERDLFKEAWRAVRAERDKWRADAERLAEALRAVVEEIYGEDGFTYNPTENAALAAHDALVARQDQP